MWHDLGRACVPWVAAWQQDSRRMVAGWWQNSGRMALEQPTTSTLQHQQLSAVRPSPTALWPDTLVPHLHTQNCLKRYHKSQHLSQGYLTLVKFTSKEYLWRKPYPIDCITFHPCRHLSHTLAKSDVVSAPPLLSVMKLLYLKATVLFLQSWRLLQSCPLPVSDSLALSAPSSATCRSSSKFPPLAC